MIGINVNNKGKIEKNAKVKEGECIFPFKYKWETHNKCYKTDKGDICATEINPKTQTLIKYGYCINRKKGTEKKALKKSKKLKIVEKNSNKTLSKTKLKSNSPLKQKTLKKSRMPKKLKIVEKDTKTNIKSKSMSPEKDRRLNEELIDILNEFGQLLNAQGELFRARAYINAADQIALVREDITTIDEIKKLPRVGKTIIKKIEEYLNTGKIAALEKERLNPIVQLTKVFGIGPKKALDLISKGITSIDELKKNTDGLTENMKIGLKYLDDIEKRIPRSEIDEYQKKLTTIFNKSTPKGSIFDIVGSYRREAKSSGDIDIIITNDEDNIESFNNFLDALIKEKLVLEVLTRGKTKSMVIAQLPNKTPRRLDLLYTSPKEFPFAILYFTGSKLFNTVQRQRALDIGFSLNEHGMYKMESGKKGPKIKNEFPTEKSIFDFLGMEYLEPSKRINANSVKYITDKVVEEEENKDVTDKKKPEKNISVVEKSQKNKTLKKKLVIKFNNIENFKKEGLSYLKTLDEESLSAMIRKANNEYYCNNKSILTDNEYDILREYTASKYPENEAVKEGHTKCDIVKNKVELPYEMWSMDKIKPDTEALPKWMKKYKGPYVLSGKLDGISGLYSTEGDKPKLYTRGNGIKGQDVSHLIPYLKLPTTPNIVIRGEFIISKEIFASKYAKNFSNSRNFVGGVINQKKIEPEKFKDIDFVAYEVIKPELKPSEQFNLLMNENVDVVRNLTEKSVTNDFLSDLLVTWRNDYRYDIDGVICVNDKIYKRTSGNPEHAFAFKMVLSDQIAEAKVLDVIWTASKDGYLKPRVQIEPVVLGGAEINYATGFNGKFIEDNKIGVGALIKLVRSGDVIPHIVAVIQPAEKALFPSEDYIWNDTHVDIELKNKKEDATVNEKIITAFFKILGVEGLGPGNVKRIIEGGFDTIPKIIDMTKEDFMKIEGFKEKLATKISDGIKKNLLKITLPELMNATNIFGRGFGTRRFTAILKEYPNILISEENSDEKIEKLILIDGMGKKSAEKFMKHLPEFLEWIEESNLQEKLNYNLSKSKSINKTHPLYGKKWVMTGKKDKELIKILENIGAERSTNVSKNTFIVLVDTLDEDTIKAETARELGIPIMTHKDFKNKYNL